MNDFLYRAKDTHPMNRLVKSIFRPEKVDLSRIMEGLGSGIILHKFPYKDGFAVDERHLQILETKTILPVVSADENGTGEEVSTLERFDAANRIAWIRDELGVVTYHRYDPVSGLRTKTIQDADLSRTAEFDVPVPDGWIGNPNALHAVSEFRYDAEGRLIESLGPVTEAIDINGNLVRVRMASWTVYDDVHRTVRSASGSVTVNDNGEIVATMLANPVSITIRDIIGKTTDRITAFRHSTDGALSASDVFPRENWLTWEKTIYSFGKVAAKRQYHAIPVTGDGMAGENYAETTFGYDVCHRNNKIVAPNGTISRSVIDWRGNAIQQWVGTNDAGATDASPKGSQPANDMVIVSESEYGGTSSCSSCCGAKSKIRVSVQHVDADTMRVTEFGYDEGGGPEKVPFETVVSKNRMDDDRLLSRVEQFYDARDQVYRTENSVVDPATGSIRGKLVSQTWHDVKGRVVKEIYPDAENSVDDCVAFGYNRVGERF